MSGFDTEDCQQNSEKNTLTWRLWLIMAMGHGARCWLTKLLGTGSRFVPHQRSSVPSFDTFRPRSGPAFVPSPRASLARRFSPANQTSRLDFSNSLYRENKVCSLRDLEGVSFQNWSLVRSNTAMNIQTKRKLQTLLSIELKLKHLKLSYSTQRALCHLVSLPFLPCHKWPNMHEQTQGIVRMIESQLLQDPIQRSSPLCVNY